MIKDRMEDAINEQITEELYSAYLYLAIAASFHEQNFDGFARWMRAQAQEEIGHAMKLFDYLVERGGRVVLDSIEKPKKEWESPLEAFKDAYEHEKHITERIHELYDLAEEVEDKATMNMLHWFIEEQVEEEASVDAIVQKLKMAEGTLSTLLRLDAKLGEREE